MKEKSGIPVVGFFLSMGVNAAFFWGLLIILFSTTLMNPMYYEKIMLRDGVVDSVYDTVEDCTSFLDFTGIDTRDLYTKDFVKHYIHDLFTHAFTNKKIDYDYYEEYLEDNIIPVIEEENEISYTNNQIKGFSSTFIDNLVKVIENNSLHNFFKGFRSFYSKSIWAGVIVLCLTIPITAFMAFVYSVKARALRNSCIAALIASILVTALFLAVRILAVITLKPFLHSGIKYFLVEPILIGVGLIILSIVGIVIFATQIKTVKLMADKMNNSNTPGNSDRLYYSNQE